MQIKFNPNLLANAVDAEKKVASSLGLSELDLRILYSICFIKTGEINKINA